MGIETKGIIKYVITDLCTECPYVTLVFKDDRLDIESDYGQYHICFKDKVPPYERILHFDENHFDSLKVRSTNFEFLTTTESRDRAMLSRLEFITKAWPNILNKLVETQASYLKQQLIRDSDQTVAVSFGNKDAKLNVQQYEEDIWSGVRISVDDQLLLVIEGNKETGRCRTLYYTPDKDEPKRIDNLK